MVTIQKKSTTQLVVENLRAHIQHDSTQVGDRFPTEKELCSTLGVGRGTFIKSKIPVPNDSLSSWFLTNEMELQDLTIVRATLEPLATRLAIERCTDEQLAALKENQAEAVSAAERQDAAALARCDEEFHRTIFTISGNALLIEINNMIAGQLAQFRQNTFKIKNNIDNFIPAHDAIIRAFETRDAALGEKKMKQHMKKVSKDLESSKYNS